MSSEKSDAGQDLDLPEPNPTTKSDIASLDREVEQSSTVTGQTKCSICQSTFRRPEHLKRHFRSHTKEKPFECTQCGRHFSRTDTLHRHELSHHTVGTEGGKDRTHRITVKTFRACFKCAVARVRCSGGAPCSRCENRSLECQYPTERRSKTKIQKSKGLNLSPEKEPTMLGQNPHPFSTIPTLVSELTSAKDGESSTSRPPAYQVAQFQLQIPGLNTGPSPSHPFSEQSAQENAKKKKENNENASIATRSSPSFLRSTTTELLRSNKPSISSFASSNQQYYPHVSNSRVQTSVTTDHGPSPSYPYQSRPTNIVNTGTRASEISASDNQHMQLNFTQPLIDQSSLSTINWLSNDLFLDPPNGHSLVSQPTSHPLHPGVFDNSLTQTSWLPPVINTEHIASSLSGHTAQTPSRTTSLGDSMDSPSHLAHDIGQAPQSRLEFSKHPLDHPAEGPNRRPPRDSQKHSSWPAQRTDSIGSLPISHRNNSPSQFCFPMVQEAMLDCSAEVLINCTIKHSKYDQIHKSFARLCYAENVLFPKFESESFPTPEILSKLVKYYFASFQPAYPMFHIPTFDPNGCHWLVIVALAAIGSHSASACQQNGTVSAFHEFLRRAIFVEKEKCKSGSVPLWLIQTIMLNCIGILHENDERGRLAALSEFSDLANLATDARLLNRLDNSSLASNETSPEQKWNAWIEDESRRRTGYLIWLVDCTIAYHFDHKPSFSLDDGQAPLPSHEKLWQAGSAQSWKEIHDEVSGLEEVSLYDAVLIMYIEKRLVPERGDFSHILLIHALYHRMWEVGDYFRRPLSFWNPTAKKQSRHLAIPSGSVWLPGIPSYSKWRNSACDCLDILHWAAETAVAKANGHEHPTVLHLHTARIVLLAPFREIRSLSTLLATDKVDWSDRQQVIEWHYILRWIKHDQYKARLAVIHAGSILWHIRRYTTQAFHEPVAVFLAVLTLWAYGLCQSQALPDPSSSVGGKREPSNESMVIHLDRPCDDELVQLFVREGQFMMGTITGVGDICAPHGPGGVLRVGCETINGLNSWGISKEFTAILTKLTDLVSEIRHL